jgi:hypothetical protein
VERIAKTSEAAPSARASRPVVATRARQSTDDRPPRPPDHIRYVGVPTGDRLLYIDSERKARREAGFNSKKRRAGRDRRNPNGESRKPGNHHDQVRDL